MRKVICTVLAVLLIGCAGVPAAFAAHHGRHNGACGSGRQCSNDGICSNNCAFVDENDDGICDNCENQCPGCGEKKDENGDGICDNCGKCGHYMDANGDGACDRHENCKKNAESHKHNRNNHHASGSGNKGGHHGKGHKHH